VFCRVASFGFARGVPRAVTVAFRFMTRRVTVVCEPVSVVCAVCLCPRGRGRGEAGAPGYMCNYRNVFRRRAHAPRATPTGAEAGEQSVGRRRRVVGR
jgi:hypothetical protein